MAKRVICYNKLWKLLIDKKMSNSDLRQAADFASNTLTSLRQDREVSMKVLMKICDALDCSFGDIVEYKEIEEAGDAQ